MKQRKLICVVLLCLLLSALAGCAGPGERPTTDIPTTDMPTTAPITAPTAGPTRPSATPTEPTSEPTQPPTAATEPPDDGSIAFTATTYIQNPLLSAEFDLEVVIQENVVRIGNMVYADITYVEHVELEYTQALLARAARLDGENGNTDIMDTLQALRNLPGCYMLENKEGAALNRIAVYKLDGAYYLLTFHDSGAVARVHIGYAAKEG